VTKNGVRVLLKLFRLGKVRKAIKIQ